MLKVLSISGLFYPHALGGAENSAECLAGWLAEQGHVVHALSAAVGPHEQCNGLPWKGIRLWRRLFPRPYPIANFLSEPGWKKPLWHVQDYFDPRNRSIIADVLEEVNPDVVLIHLIKGIGFNAIEEIARRRLPVVYYLHDLGLACGRMSMFRNGSNCSRQCTICGPLSRLQLSILRKIETLGFCSPSKANLAAVEKYVNIADRPRRCIPNANRYPHPTVGREESALLRVLYVGRLHAQKGIDVVLEAIRQTDLAPAVCVTVVGSGPQEQELRSRYGALQWCSFTGHVSQSVVANHMQNADVLVVPSVWFENYPGVVVQALKIGLPVLGSNIGGIPELVRDDVNGALLPPGDVGAWAAKIAQLAKDKLIRIRWRENAVARRGDFDQDTIGAQHEQFIRMIAGGPRAEHA